MQKCRTWYMQFKMYKENHIVIHNESSYDYDFTMEELSE